MLFIPVFMNNFEILPTPPFIKAVKYTLQMYTTLYRTILLNGDGNVLIDSQLENAVS